MALTLHRPERVDVRIVADARARQRPRPAAAAAMDLVVRGLLTGIGAGLVAVADGVISVTAVGILALGAALLSWER
jgi:hypothetical protein